MKKLDFDVFSLITPTSKPAQPSPPAHTRPPRPRSAALMLAAAIRQNAFILPQVELVGKQMTRAPSPVRHLRFGRHEVADYDLRHAVQSLPDEAQRAMRSYLWNNGQFVRDEETGQWRELAPILTAEAERAFGQVYRVLREACALRAPTRSSGGVDDGGLAL